MAKRTIDEVERVTSPEGKIVQVEKQQRQLSPLVPVENTILSPTAGSTPRGTALNSDCLEVAKLDLSTMEVDNGESIDFAKLLPEGSPPWASALGEILLTAQNKQTHTLKECIQGILKENSSLNEQVNLNKEGVSGLKAKYEKLERENVEIKKKLVDLEARSRRDNLKIYNVPESEGENLRIWFGKFLSDKLGFLVPTMMDVDRIHHIGKPGGKGTRPTIIKFTKYSDREAVWNRRKELKDSGISMSEHFPEEIDRKRRTLFPIMKAARRDGQRAFLAVDKLIINQQTYTVDTLSQLPEEYKLDRITLVRDGSFIFFFGRECPLSNFYISEFTLDGHTFNSTEQFIQFSKAKMFSDTKTAEDILREPEPSKQKALWRKVVDFDKKMWEDSVEAVISRGIANW